MRPMQNPLDRCTDQHRNTATRELEAELAEFSFDGLVQLRVDLADGRVLRGSWTGCVISYKAGRPGSIRRDRSGRARNAFTVLWDHGWITDEEVLAAVDHELAARRPAPAEASADPCPRVAAPASPPFSAHPRALHYLAVTSSTRAVAALADPRAGPGC